LTPDARLQHQILARSKIDQRQIAGPFDPETLKRELADAAWLVDALLGTGLARPVEGDLRSLIELINASGIPVLALDLPSGLDADLGVPLGIAVQATATVTFVAPKAGFSAPGAAAYTGAVHVADIGVPRVLLAPFASSDSHA
jgi:NAD(P)H-hydrate epimerase